MTITDKLEGLLPADGNYTTKDERVIAAAVAELRAQELVFDLVCRDTDATLARMGDAVTGTVWGYSALAFAAGCIASAIYVVLV